MKKLMIAAAAAAMVGGVFAENCQPGTVTTDCAQVYNVAFSGKTTVGAYIKGIEGTNSSCTPGVATGALWVRVPGSFALAGWAAICACECGNLYDQTTWTESAFWLTKPYKTAVADATWTFNFMNVIGKNNTQAETAGTFTGKLTDLAEQTFSITFAGLGKYTQSTLSWSLSGNFAGTMSPSYYVSKTLIEEDNCGNTDTYCAKTIVFACNDLSTAVCDVDTVVYGSWSIKYNASASKIYAKNGTTPKIVVK